MIIAPEGITADVTQRGIFQGAGKGGVSGQLVHPHADDAERTGQQVVGTGAHHTETGHPFHFAVILFIQPCLQFGFTGAEVDIGDPHLLEPKLCAPLFDLLR